jgi:hypothetical protein
MKRHDIERELSQERLALRCFLFALLILIVTILEVHTLHIGLFFRIIGTIGVLSFVGAGTLALMTKR